MLKICLVFWESEPQYAYKLHAYKKKTCNQENTGISQTCSSNSCTVTEVIWIRFLQSEYHLLQFSWKTLFFVFLIMVETFW